MAKRAWQPVHRLGTAMLVSLHPHVRLLAVVGLLLGACGGHGDPARMREAVEPYLDEMAEYDRWARRLSLADAAFRSDEAMEEAAFAPLRTAPRVAAAWLVRAGPDAHLLTHPEGAPALPEDGWTRVRTDALGMVDAQAKTMRIDGREREYLLIRRSAPAPGEATLHVTLAFTPEEGDAPADEP